MGVIKRFQFQNSAIERERSDGRANAPNGFNSKIVRLRDVATANNEPSSSFQFQNSAIESCFIKIDSLINAMFQFQNSAIERIFASSQASKN